MDVAARSSNLTGGKARAMVEKSEPTLPNLTAIRAYDRQQHIQKSLEAGLSRDEAERHADDEMKHWSPRAIEDNVAEE